MSYPAVTDADLATDAAAGDPAAFANLLHRHIEAAWRLAQATAASSEVAARAATNAFVGTLRLVGRGRDDVADQFRPHVLAAVYREVRTGPDRESPIGHAGGGPGLATAVTAFAKLPSRWRAAVWLQEVEGLAASVAGPILGVSSAAAVQLNKRGLAGMERRVLQAGGTGAGPDLAAALVAGLAPLPPDVAARTEAKWHKAVARDRRQAVAAGGWLTERAPRPLAAAAVGLCALGIIGLAVVAPAGTVRRLTPGAPVAAGVPAGQTGLAGGGIVNPGNGNGGARNANGSGGAATGSTSTAGSSAGSQGPQLVATGPPTAAPVDVTVTTQPPATLPPATLPPVTLPPVTLPPVTLPPITLPPVTLPPVTTPTTIPRAAPTPLVQVTLNTGPVGVNLGVGAAACTGVQVLTIKLGCTGGAPGLTLGGTLLGSH
jgi:hypothetical protein